MADLTNSVMKRVASWEKRRVVLWAGVFILILGILIVIFAQSALRAGTIITNRGSLELLTLFKEDPETIGEFWQDTLTTFWEELPHRRLFITFLVGGTIALVFLVTKKARKILRKKIDHLRQFPR